MIRNIIMAFFLLVLFLFQTTFRETITIGEIAPNLLLIFTCCMGFIKGKKTGMVLGCISGILLDIFFGYGGVIGLSGLAFMYIGYVNGLFNEIFYTDDICIPVILSMVSNLAYNLLYYFIAHMLKGQLDVMLYFRNIMFPEMIYTGCVTVFAYRILKVIDIKLLKYEKRGEEKLVKGDMGEHT